MCSLTEAQNWAKKKTRKKNKIFTTLQKKTERDITQCLWREVNDGMGFPRQREHILGVRNGEGDLRPSRSPSLRLPLSFRGSLLACSLSFLRLRFCDRGSLSLFLWSGGSLVLLLLCRERYCRALDSAAEDLVLVAMRTGLWQIKASCTKNEERGSKDGVVGWEKRGEEERGPRGGR
jgi:hypothetical protein